MTRSRLALLLALVVAIPAAAAAGGSFFGAASQPCFTSGAAAYRLSGGASANYTVRIDNEAARPDLRLQLVDAPDAADFVLLDDADNADACRAANTVKTIRIDAAAANPDITRDAVETGVRGRSQDLRALGAIHRLRRGGAVRGDLEKFARPRSPRPALAYLPLNHPFTTFAPVTREE